MSWTPESLAEVPLRCVAHADGSATALWIYEADEPPISKLVTLNRRTGRRPSSGSPAAGRAIRWTRWWPPWPSWSWRCDPGRAVLPGAAEGARARCRRRGFRGLLGGLSEPPAEPQGDRTRGLRQGGGEARCATCRPDRSSPGLRARMRKGGDRPEVHPARADLADPGALRRLPAACRNRRRLFRSYSRAACFARDRWGNRAGAVPGLDRALATAEPALPADGDRGVPVRGAPALGQEPLRGDAAPAPAAQARLHARRTGE